MAPTQSQIDNLTQQAQRIQQGINKYAKSKGVNLKRTGSSYTVEPINAEMLRPTTPMNITPATPATGAIGMMESLAGMAQSNASQYTQNLQNKAQELKAPTESLLDQYNRSIMGQKGETQATSEAYADTVDPIQRELNDINQQILSEQQANRRRIQALEKNPQGMFGGNLQSEIQRVNNESLAKQADLSVIQMGIQGRYDSAKEIADRAVAVKMEQQRNYLDALKFNYEENKELFTTAEQRAFEAAQSDRERALDREEADLKTISDISLELLKAGNSAVAAKVRTAKTVEEAMKLAGSSLGTLNNEIKEINGRTALVNKITGAVKYLDGGESTENQYSITQDMFSQDGGDDVVSKISQIIKLSGAKPSEQTNNAINVIAGIKSFADANTDGTFPGLAPVRLAPGKFKTPEQIANLASIEAINLKVQQWASGAALTDAQTKQVARLTPKKGDTDKQVRAKTNELTNYMLSQVRGQLAGQGIDFVPEKIDLFKPKPVTPEQKLKTFYENPQYKTQIEQAISIFPEYSADEILQIMGLSN